MGWGGGGLFFVSYCDDSKINGLALLFVGSPRTAQTLCKLQVPFSLRPERRVPSIEGRLVSNTELRASCRDRDCSMQQTTVLDFGYPVGQCWQISLPIIHMQH